MIASEIASSIAIAKHWLEVAEAPWAHNSIQEGLQRTARRMGRNQCAWLLFQDEQGVIQLPDEERTGLQRLVIRHDSSYHQHDLTVFESQPVYRSAITASIT